VRSRLGLVSLVIFVLLATAACDANKPSRSGAPASTQAGHPAGHTATTVPANASPKQLRARFEQLTGQLGQLVDSRLSR
jgi:TolA-binding protein